MQFSQVNWLAVIVGTVFNMALGFLWYGPFFGKPWLAAMEKMGKKREDMKMSAAGFLLPLIGAFLSALVLDLIILAFGGTDWWMGLIVGVVVWVGVGASATLTAGVFESRPAALWIIGFFYFLVIYGALGGSLQSGDDGDQEKTRRRHNRRLFSLRVEEQSFLPSDLQSPAPAVQ